MNFLPSEKYYRNLFRDTPLAYFIINTSNGNFLDCNKAARKLTGYSKKALLQMKVFEIFADTPVGRPKAQKIFKNLKAGKNISNIELQVQPRKGNLRWIRLSLDPEVDPAGNVVRSRIAMLDISDLKKQQDEHQQAYAKIIRRLEKRTLELSETNERLIRQIEAHRKMKKALVESENNYRILAENANDGIVLSSGENKNVYANKRASEITGYSNAELLSGGFKLIVHPDDLTEARRRYQKRMGGEDVPNCFELRMVHKGGRVIPVEVSSSKTVWQGQTVVIAIFRDITERKQFELDLRSREENYRMLVEKMNDALGVQDQNGLWKYVNDRFCEMFGYSREEVIGSRVTDFLDGTNRKIFEKQMVGRRKGRRTAYELKWRHKENHYFSTIVSAQPLMDEAGKYTGSFAVITDISPLKQAKAALRESEKIFKTLAENAQDGIIVIDLGGKIVYVNSWFKKVTGFKMSDIMKGNGTTRLIDKAVNEIHLQKLRKRLAAEPEPSRYETEIITKADRAVPVEFTASKTTWHGHAAVLLIVRDIISQKQTESKLLREQLKLENRIKERSRELEDTNKALAVLARNIDQKREKMQEDATMIVNSKIMPIIEDFQKSKEFTRHRSELDLVQTYVNKISRGFKKDTGIIFSLSNAELRIATMIKNGYTSPQVARLLNISPDTVKTHRKNIRKKLNIRNARINLVTYLRVNLK